MKISIIIPVYNAEQYLQECLDSVVNQTYKDIEVIIVDDGSTDRSSDICKKYLSDKRVIYYCQKNAGPSAARNAGLSLATGDYICFVDSDDWLELDALERLQNENADIVIYNFYHGDNKHYEPLTDGVYSQEALFPNMISYVDNHGEVAYVFHNLWIRLFKRKIIEDHGICFDTRFHNGEDLLFTYQATIAAETISVRYSEYLYHYRPMMGSLTSKYISDFWNLRKQIIEEIYGLVSSDVLLNQMPLRIFSWAVAGVENELRSPNGSKDIIRVIVQDPICDVFKRKVDVSGLNDKNQRYYNQICDGDYNGIWKDHQKEEFRRRKRRLIKKVKKVIKKILRYES